MHTSRLDDTLVYPHVSRVPVPFPRTVTLSARGYESLACDESGHESGQGYEGKYTIIECAKRVVATRLIA